MSDEPGRDYIQSIERCILVIKTFTDGKPYLSFTEIATATGLSKPTVRRILLTLEHLGYTNSLGSRFCLTPKVLELGYAYLSSQNLPEIAQPIMEKLTDCLRESTSLVTLDGSDVVYINRVHRHRITSITLAVGTRLPAHATSSGHVLLADLSEEALAQYFKYAELRALTDKTIIDQDALRARLQHVRNQGWDAVDQELELGRRSIAAPIRDTNARVIAALSFSCGIGERNFEQMKNELLQPLLDAAAHISSALGSEAYARK